MNKNLRIFTFIFTLIYFFSSTVGPTLAAITYTYDANGNMTSNGTNCYEYNDANQIKKVKKCSNNETIAEYVYDYKGNRVVKKNYTGGNLQKTVFSPSDDFETVKLASNGATQNTSYYYANDQLIAKKDPSGAKTYYHNDHLGSTSVMTDQSGVLAESTKYDPWGEVKTGGTKSKFLYTGQEKDLETGLNYYNYRYYDSHIRRFTQPDDIIQDVYNPQDLNRYSYVRNNPLKYIDPTGHVVQIPVAIYLYATSVTAAPDTQLDMQFIAMAASAFMNKPNAENRNDLMLGVAGTLVPGVSAAQVKGASNIAKAVTSGKYGETQLAKIVNGGKQYFSVPGSKGGRIVDAYDTAKKSAHESKSGYTALTKSIQQQINKDKVLLKTDPRITSYTWHFYTSPVTKKGGASGPLKQALKKAGIKYIIH